MTPEADVPATPIAAPEPAAPQPKPGVFGKMERLMAEYGPIALGTYLGIFALTWAGFATALSVGLEVSSAAGGAGLFGASWLATKVTQPLRIGATALLTPLVATVTRRRKRPQ